MHFFLFISNYSVVARSEVSLPPVKAGEAIPSHCNFIKKRSIKYINLF